MSNVVSRGRMCQPELRILYGYIVLDGLGSKMIYLKNPPRFVSNVRYFMLRSSCSFQLTNDRSIDIKKTFTSISEGG